MFKKSRDGGYIVERAKSDGVVYATPQLVMAYHKQQYEDIFPEYVPGDIVEYMAEDGVFVLYIPAGKGGLPPGVYTIGGGFNISLISVDIPADRFLPTPTSTALLEDARLFFDSKDRYERLGLAHRRGVLLHGPPGNGKTRTALEVSSSVKDAITIVLKDQEDLEYISDLAAELSGNIILIFEEVEMASDLLLQLLDGLISMQHTYFVGCTNHLPNLADALRDRPGRISRYYEFGYPDAEQIKNYFENHKLIVDDALIRKAIGLSVDCIRAAVIDHLINGVPLWDAVNAVGKSSSPYLL